MLDLEHLDFDERLRLLAEPDNLRSGVSKASRHKQGVNPANHDLAEHYGMAMLPARTRQPKGGVFNHRGMARTAQKWLCRP